jgi:alkylmercury lyase
MTPILESTLTCPDCGTQAVETMPTDACLYFYTCTGCGNRLKPKHGDCCVFCSYGSVPCPPIQMGDGNACCAAEPTTAVPGVCSLQPGAFHERMAEITALMQTHGGVAERTPDGVALRFNMGEGLRAALDALAEKERSCCATLEFTVTEESGSISFAIGGQASNSAAVEDLAARLGVARLSAELRAGVHRPDWSKITLPKAREVLQRRLAAHPSGVSSWAGLDEAEDKALTAVLRYFANHGRGPSIEDVAGTSGQPFDTVRRELESLRVRDLVVLDESGASILAAYPFAAYPTGLRVTVGSQTVDSLCAIDALGTGAMCETETTIGSACAHCGKRIHIATSSSGMALAAAEPPTAVVWYTLTFAGCAAQSRCPSTVFFCHDDHLTAWRASQGAQIAGDRLTVEEALEIGIALFGPLLRFARYGIC